MLEDFSGADKTLPDVEQGGSAAEVARIESLRELLEDLRERASPRGRPRQSGLDIPQSKLQRAEQMKSPRHCGLPHENGAAQRRGRRRMRQEMMLLRERTRAQRRVGHRLQITTPKVNERRRPLTARGRCRNRRCRCHLMVGD
jgi:hypothetical protein